MEQMLRDKVVDQTFADHVSQTAWAHIEGLGWLQLAPEAVDGFTNVFILLNAACANNKEVTLVIEDSNNQITTAYMHAFRERDNPELPRS